MTDPGSHRFARERVAVIFMGLALLGTSAPARALAAVDARLGRASSEPSYPELLGQAEDHRAAGEHVRSAPLYAAAYRTLPPERRVSGEGDILIQNATDDYEIAFEKTGDIELLRDCATLLEQHLETQTQRGHARSAEIGERLEGLRATLEEHEAASESPRATPPAPEVEPDPPVEPPSASHERGPADSGSSDRPAPKGGATRDLVLLGVGIAATAGGAAMLGAGGWMYGAANDRAQANLDAIDQALADAATGTRTDAQREADEQTVDAYRDDTDRWRTRSLGRATGLLVAGAIVATAGLGLTIWGALRVKRRKRISGVARGIRLYPSLGHGQAHVMIQWPMRGR